jgi:hypothetical protein
VAVAGIEPVSYLADAVKLRESRRGEETVCEHGRECNQGTSEASTHHPSHRHLPIPISGQYSGTSSIKMMYVTSDKTAPTFSISLWSKYPYE